MKNKRKLGTAAILPAEVAFDIDGVFADTFRVFVETAQREYGVKIEYDEITEYEFWKVMDIEEDVTLEIIQRIIDFPLQMGIKPLEGSVQVLKRLSGRGPLLFVTARPERFSIFEWVCNHLELNDPGQIRVEAAGAHEEKCPILQDYGVKYFVEDRLETCYVLDKASVRPIVFDQPWNRKPHPFPTVKNWQEIAGIIEW